MNAWSVVLQSPWLIPPLSWVASQITQGGLLPPQLSGTGEPVHCLIGPPVSKTTSDRVLSINLGSYTYVPSTP